MWSPIKKLINCRSNSDIILVQLKNSRSPFLTDIRVFINRILKEGPVMLPCEEHILVTNFCHGTVIV